jgi:hypothetical protein
VAKRLLKSPKGYVRMGTAEPEGNWNRLLDDPHEERLETVFWRKPPQTAVELIQWTSPKSNMS